MRIRKPLVRKEFAMDSIESAIQYCLSIIKSQFVKVAKESVI